MKRLFLPSLLLLVLGLFTGCASYEVSRGSRSLTGVKRFFVLSNANDNRALDHQIVAALRARDLRAEAGPHTMMPDDTDAVVTYQEQWTWDFGEHLVYLQISVRDRNSAQNLAVATFSTRLPTRTSTAGIVDGVVTKLLENGKR